MLKATHPLRVVHAARDARGVHAPHDAPLDALAPEAHERAALRAFAHELRHAGHGPHHEADGRLEQAAEGADEAVRLPARNGVIDEAYDRRRKPLRVHAPRCTEIWHDKHKPKR